MITLTNDASLLKLRAEQKKLFWASSPGSAFNAFSEKLSSMQSGDAAFALSLDSGEAVVYDKDGLRLRASKTVKRGDSEEVVYSDVLSNHRGWVRELNAAVVPGSTPCVADVDGTRFGAGLFIVVGAGSVGKTPFAHALASLMCKSDSSDWATIRFGEPLAGYHSDFDELVDDVAVAVANHKVTVVDSFKNVIATAGGTTASGGLSRGAFNLFSDLGALAATRGCAVIIAVNPSASDAKVLDLLVEATKSNSTTLITTNDGSNFTAYSRTGEGLLRVSSPIYGEYRDDVMVANTSGDSAKRSSASARPVRVQTTMANQDEISAVLNRMFSRSQI